MPILCYANVLPTAQLCIALKTFEGNRTYAVCARSQNQYWADRFILLSLISRSFRSEEFYILFPRQNACSCDYSTVCLFCLIRNTSVAVSAFKSLHRQTPSSHIFFPHKKFGKLITNFPLVSLITSTLQKHSHCHIFLFLTLLF